MQQRLFYLLLLSLILSPPVQTFAMGNRPAAPPQGSPKIDETDAVWVGKSDNAKSCGTERAIDLDKMSKELSTVGVQVLSKKKLHDGKMRIQMCGADKGDQNGFLIPKKDLDKAKALGFEQFLNAK